MNLPIRPILSALLRNRTGAILVAIQIAITLAVLVNAVYIVKQRVDRINRPTGLDLENIFAISANGFARDYDHAATLRDDLDYLRRIPGVIGAIATTAAPLSDSGSSQAMVSRPRDADSNFDYEFGDGNIFEVDEQGVQTLGTRIIAGRNFRADEILPVSPGVSAVPSVIVTQSYANRLFPNENALGRTVYDYLNRPRTIIGIMENMHGSWPTVDHPDRLYLVPRLPEGPRLTYLVRTQPGQRDMIMRRVEQELGPANPHRAVRWVRSLEQLKAETYMRDRNTGIFLTAVTVLLLAITSLGIFGLATFNVNTRTRQVGTRRAIGARRLDIVAHFMVENWLITTAGIFAGCAAALGVGHWLSMQYEFPRLDLYYLVGGVLGLWLLGLAAAWQPARRAARISPAVATRTI